jgi:hypothetical protein
MTVGMVEGNTKGGALVRVVDGVADDTIDGVED